MTTNFFHLSLLLLFLDPGSGMGKNQDPGSGINIPDPQHWLGSWIFLNFLLLFEGGSSSGGGGSHSNAGPGEGKDVVELTEANFRKKVINSEKVSLSQLYARASVLQIRYRQIT